MGVKDNVILRTLILVGFLAFLGFLVPQSVGLGAGGFDTEFVLQQFTFYLSGAIYLAIIIIFAFILFVWKRGNEYGDNVAFASQGEFPSLSYFKRFGSIQLIWLSTIIFGFIGLWALLTDQKAFTGFRVLEQQFTPTSELLYSSLLIPIAENAGAHALIAVLIFSLTYFAVKQGMSRANFRVLSIVAISLLVGVYGWINHLLRYGGSEISKFVVLIFWTIGGFITLITGSFIPFWIMHLMNNLIFDLRRFADVDVIRNYFIGILLLLTVAYILYYGVYKK